MFRIHEVFSGPKIAINLYKKERDICLAFLFCCLFGHNRYCVVKERLGETGGTAHQASNPAQNGRHKTTDEPCPFSLAVPRGLRTWPCRACNPHARGCAAPPSCRSYLSFSFSCVCFLIWLHAYLHFSAILGEFITGNGADDFC